MLRYFNLAVLLMLTACAGSPTYENYGADGTLIPRSVATAPQRAIGKKVLWGGVILKTVNLKDRTQVEVLAYPLDTDTRPKIDDVPLGRFIFEQAGFLEPASYANQRQVTVVGTVTGTLPGQVGDADYNFPRVTASKLTLWPQYRYPGDTRSNIHFGIGVGSGGSWGGGIGVGF